MITGMPMKAKILRYIRKAGRLYSQLAQSKREAKLIGILDFAPGEFQRYIIELEATGLRERLKEAKREFAAAIACESGDPDSLKWGSLGYPHAVVLYCIVRKHRPEIVVETGVCNGLSSTTILEAMHTNRGGRLYSIDLPQTLDEFQQSGSEEPGACLGLIPSGRKPGWLVPEEFRNRWELQLGRTQDLLPPLLEELGTIDMFLHDSEHSYECMTFEYNQAYPRLCQGGLLLSDDVNWNDAFGDFARTHNVPSIMVTTNVGLIRK